jgi:hypothetical protein
MLHAFHYEPQGQRQQFEPREAQENLKQRQMHLHFSLDLHLNLGARLRRASRSTIGRVTTIFAAFMGALALALSPYWTQAHGVQTPPTLDTLFSLAGHLVFAGVLLGVGTVRFGLANEATQPHPFSSPDPRESASHRLLPAQRVHHASEQPASSILSQLAPPPLLRWNRG